MRKVVHSHVVVAGSQAPQIGSGSRDSGAQTSKRFTKPILFAAVQVDCRSTVSHNGDGLTEEIMRNAVIAAIVLLGATIQCARADDMPKGSYLSSCSKCTMYPNHLTCLCQDGQGK